MKPALLFFLSAFFVLSAGGQSSLPVIRACASKVDVKDDDFLDRGGWHLSPEIRPDVYKAYRSRKPKWVTFYTDVDSFRVQVLPGSKTDFIILLNDEDSCFTRIESAVNTTLQSPVFHQDYDTIPFELTPEDTIRVMAILNQRDTLWFHFDLGTLLFRITPQTLRQLKDLRTERGGNPEEKLIQSIQMGRQVWHLPEVRVGQLASRNMHGRFGWQAFDDRILELDYDHRRIILHPRLPQKAGRFQKLDIRFIQSHFCVEARIRVGEKTYAGTFLFDTGSNLAMALDSTWISQQKFPTNLPHKKSLAFQDGAGNRYETQVVLVPEILLGNDSVKEIPTSLLYHPGPLGPGIHYLGNALLKRFNLLIDLQQDVVYLEKNRMIGEGCKEQ